MTKINICFGFNTYTEKSGCGTNDWLRNFPRGTEIFHVARRWGKRTSFYKYKTRNPLAAVMRLNGLRIS